MRWLLTLALAFVLAACGGGGEPAAEPQPVDTVSSPTAPAIEGTTLDGDRLDVADLRGRPVLVNVWSSW
jgi:hypothetical protein